jgi:hypothetical protein
MATETHEAARRRSSVTERGVEISEAVVHRLGMPAGIKGRPYVC